MPARIYTFFDSTGYPIQHGSCTPDEVAACAAHLGSQHVVEGQHLDCRLVNGAPVQSDPRPPDRAVADLRMARDAALRQSDVLALRALESLLPDGLRQYRQALRDLPAAATVADIDSIPWPTVG
jgi:Phage tail assembly chaperone protein